MIKLMEHIEYFYEPIPTLDGQTKYFVYLKDGEWQLIEDGKYLLVKTKKPRLIFDMLKDFGADLEIFHMLLKGCVAVEAVNHIQALQICEDLVGKEAIEQARLGAENLAKSIKGAVEKVRKDKLKNERQLKVVK